MRSSTSGLALAAALLALAGCGNWSNEDLRFYAALPTRADLRVTVPEAAAAAAGPGGPVLLGGACGALGDATTWLWAKPTSDKLNASVDWVLQLVDVVRRVPPTTRLADGRIWGPFDDGKHPGVELRIVILRSWPDGPDAAPVHAYAFEGRRKDGAGAFAPIIAGTFVGASAGTGRGTLTLDFAAAWALGIADADSPHGQMVVTWARAAEPRTVGISLAQSPGFGLVQFDYAWQGWADGRGTLAYAFTDGAGDLFTVQAGFDGAGAGRGTTAVRLASGPTGQFSQCWDAGACLTWVDDPSDYSCGRPGCSGGSATACPAVPVP